MNKVELTQAIVTKTGLSEADANRAVDAIFDDIVTHNEQLTVPDTEIDFDFEQVYLDIKQELKFRRSRVLLILTVFVMIVGGLLIVQFFQSTSTLNVGVLVAVLFFVAALFRRLRPGSVI